MKTPNSNRTAAGFLFALALIAPSARAAAIFPVDISDPSFTLYVDPNTGLEVKRGGFSGLVPVPHDHTGTLFHVVTDRGPTADPVPVGKGFVIPDLSPSILTIRLEPNGTAKILEVLPLRTPQGDPVSGLPNACNTDEDPIVDLSGNALARDPDGLDVEGLTNGPFGTFWVSEEYSPSVALVAPTGKVLLRLVPEGAICGGERIPTFDLLPRVLRKKVTNRGLEGISLNQNGRLYTVMQRPLANPDKATSEASRNTRLVEVNLLALLRGAPNAVRQLLYVTEGPANRGTHASDLFSVGPGALLVSERRTDKVFKITVSSATDVTGLEDADGQLLVPFQPDPMTPAKTTIEQLTPADLATLGIVSVEKTLVFSGLKAIDPALDKVEGICWIGGTLVVCPDNDFNLLGGDFTTTPATLIFQSPPNLPKIITIPGIAIP